MTVHLEPGRFYAGISLPFFVTHAMVQHKLEGMGFTNISFHDRTDTAGLSRLARGGIDPKKYPAYDDSWSEWIEADWTGPKKDLDFDKHWSWLLVVPRPIPTPSGAGPVPSSMPPTTNPEAGFPVAKSSGISAGTIVLGLLALGVCIIAGRST